ncbi:ribbon-helix-helix protein, CopG family [Alcaligenaceae bacterium SJ-26]|nr:ribbon-helix-helix protein, CopG family [Alcaligenaceae bacterium SJ-26]
MAITRKPTAAPAPVERRADDFISAAPDSAEPRRVRKGKKVQISLTISEPLLKRVDERAEQIGQSRAAVINLAIFQALDSGLRIDGSD